MKVKTTHPLVDHRPRFYSGRVGNNQCQGRVLKLVRWPPQILQSRLGRDLACMLRFLWQILLNQVCSSIEESKSFVFDGRLDVLVVAEVL